MGREREKERVFLHFVAGRNIQRSLFESFRETMGKKEGGCQESFSSGGGDVLCP